jgi:hypothetical protein
MILEAADLPVAQARRRRSLKLIRIPPWPVFSARVVESVVRCLS